MPVDIHPTGSCPSTEAAYEIGKNFENHIWTLNTVMVAIMMLVSSGLLLTTYYLLLTTYYLLLTTYAQYFVSIETRRSALVVLGSCVFRSSANSVPDLQEATCAVYLKTKA